MNKVEKADKFWKNFLTIKDELLDIDSLDDRKAEELLLVLDKYLKEFQQVLILNFQTLLRREGILTFRR